MRLEISRSVIDAIVTESDRVHWREVCGLLLGTPERIDAVLMCNNVAADPATMFEVDPSQLIAAHRDARSGAKGIVGSFHSHPLGAPVPSERDAAAAAPDGSIWLIAAGRGVGVWRAVENGERHGRFISVAWEMV